MNVFVSAFLNILLKAFAMLHHDLPVESHAILRIVE